MIEKQAMTELIWRLSHPSWVRGLKFVSRWKEGGLNYVAPFMGAWIEIRWWAVLDIRSWSHPSWVRGLKSVLPKQAIWNEKSHPSWVRGLKLCRHYDNLERSERESHPSWVRGLKSGHKPHQERFHLVAPFMGAWIEILPLQCMTGSTGCRTLHGCVDWNFSCVSFIQRKSKSHPSWVRGLKSVFR